MNAITIPSEVQKDLEVEAGETSKAMALLQAFEIVTPEDFEYAGDLVKTVKQRFAELEEQRTKVTKPLLEVKRQIDAWFKPVTDPLKQAEVVLKSKIAAYTLAQRAAVERTMQAAAEALQSGDAATAAEHVAALAPATQTQGVSVRATYGFRIVDPDLVPRNFCSPDPEKIRNALPREVHEKLRPQIAGVEIFVEGSVTVRR